MAAEVYSRKGLDRLLGRIRRIVGDRSQAEDLLQSAFMRLEESGRRQAVINPEAYLVRVATNIAIDEGRRRKARRTSFGAKEELGLIADSYPLADEVMVARERLRAVKRALSTLTPRTRRIFLMHRIDGLKYREIAVACGITVSAVEKHIARAVLALSDEVRRI